MFPLKPFFCQHAGGTSSLLLVQVFSESHGSHNRFRLVALPAPLLFLLKVPSMPSFSFFLSQALIIFSLLLLLMNCSFFSYLWGPAASWGARLEGYISHPSQSL